MVHQAKYSMEGNVFILQSMSLLTVKVTRNLFQIKVKLKTPPVATKLQSEYKVGLG